MRWMVSVGFTLGAALGCSERVYVAGPDVDTGVAPVPADDVDVEGDGEQGDGPDSACGPTHEIDLTVTGELVRPTGAPVADAAVWLEQRDWGPTVVLGAGATDAAGHFAFGAAAVPIVERCWAIGPQFWVIGAKGELRGEDGANLELVTAFLGGAPEASLLQPLVTEY